MDAEGTVIYEGCRKCFIENVQLPFDGVFQAFNRYEKGHLHKSGGWEDQPSIYCECIELLQALVTQMDHKRHKENMNKLESNKPDVNVRGNRR